MWPTVIVVVDEAIEPGLELVERRQEGLDAPRVGSEGSMRLVLILNNMRFMRHLSRSLSRPILFLGPLLLLVFAVAGCGSSSSEEGTSDTPTTVVETTPTTAADDDHDHDGHDHDNDDDGHDHDGDGHDHDDEDSEESSGETVRAGELTRGRLVAASATLPEVYVVDLDTFKVSTLPVAAPNAILQGTGGMSPYSWMVHYADDRVEIVDVGIDFVRHGAHYHIDDSDPELTTFSMTGPNPAHIVEHGGLVAVFFDGSGEVRLVAEDQLTSGGDVDVESVMANMPHHGVALNFHDHLLVTTAETVDERAVPNGVVAFAHDDPGTTEYESEACTNLHGEAPLDHYIAYGCDEGVLILHHTHVPTSGFSSVMVPYPDDSGPRPFFLKSHTDAPVIVGISGQGLVAVDPFAPAAIGHSLPSAPKEFAFEDGQHLLVLAADGDLYRVSLDDFSVEGEPLPLVPPFDEDDTANVHVAANRLYALDSRDESVVAVDLEAWEILDAGIVLPSAPNTFAFRAVSAVSPDWQS